MECKDCRYFDESILTTCMKIYYAYIELLLKAQTFENALLLLTCLSMMQQGVENVLFMK